MLLALAPDDRRREVHVISNDTLVESPPVVRHLKAVMGEIEAAASAWRLPLRTVITRPNPGATFWVNLIGRGYPSPNRNFRWCTDRLKIQPTSAYIRGLTDTSGGTILLLGVRRDESSTRARSVARYDNGQRLHRHNDLAGCMVFRPIKELSTEDVWEFLGSRHPPWGGSHAALIRLYRDALAGECPMVTQKSDAPSCGTASARFGCWTCTVVAKDRSLNGFVEAGFAEFGPLLEFRDWLASIRNDPDRRMARRRNGRITVAANGLYVPGPFTLETRMEILVRLHALQAATGMELISPAEEARIRAIWAEDALAAAARMMATPAALAV